MTGRIRCVQWRVALVILTVWLAGCVSTMRKSPRLEERRKTISTVAEMPPDVEIIEDAFKGAGKRLRDDEDHARIRLRTVVTKAIEKRGYRVRDAKLDEAHFREEPDLRFKTTQIQEAFARTMREAYETRSMERSKAFHYERTLGPDVNVFADRAGVDALLFVRMNGFKKSAGQRGMDLLEAITLGYMQPGEACVVEVALVDGTTGDLLWSNMGQVEDIDGFMMSLKVKGLINGLPKHELSKAKNP
jgi:hypothetical protein